MGVWEYGSMGVWEYGSMGVWEYGSIVILLQLNNRFVTKRQELSAF